MAAAGATERGPTERGPTERGPTERGPTDAQAADSGGALLLAAGRGARFGADKRLHVMADGNPVILATAKRYAEVFARFTVVLRPGETDIAKMLADELGERAPVTVYAEAAHLGMGHSLASGVRQITDWTYVFVALADMPFVTTDTLRRLKRAMAPDTIILPTLDGKPGHPVGFANSFFAELRQCRGDAGARQVIAAHPGKVTRVKVSDSGVLRDIDRPADLDISELG